MEERVIGTLTNTLRGPLGTSSSWIHDYLPVDLVFTDTRLLVIRREDQEAWARRPAERPSQGLRFVKRRTIVVTKGPGLPPKRDEARPLLDPSISYAAGLPITPPGGEAQKAISYSDVRGVRLYAAAKSQTKEMARWVRSETFTRIEVATSPEKALAKISSGWYDMLSLRVGREPTRMERAINLLWMGPMALASTQRGWWVGLPTRDLEIFLQQTPLSQKVRVLGETKQAKSWKICVGVFAIAFLAFLTGASVLARSPGLAAFTSTVFAALLCLWLVHRRRREIYPPEGL